MRDDEFIRDQLKALAERPERKLTKERLKRANRHVQGTIIIIDGDREITVAVKAGRE